MTDIMDRMKRYERCWRLTITPRMPIIMRVDGKAFHTYTKKCNRPFDIAFISAMWETAKDLCKEIQGAQLAYVQSDEISILIHSYKTLNSESWFGNQVQKMVSVSASIASATMSFESIKIFDEYKKAHFDSRVFSIPESDVCNYFIARQQDWTRNSVQMLARSIYPDKQLLHKNNAKLHEMCFSMGRNWNDLPIYLKRGACIIRKVFTSTGIDGQEVTRSSWEVDKEIPIFTQDRSYINKYLEVEEC